MTRRIVAVLPNPAIDRSLTLRDRLAPTQLHRVIHVREAAGGKGVNLARAVRALGGEVVVATVVAGHNGRKFRALLDAQSMPHVLEETEGETRQCSIVLDGGPHPTELNEAGPAYDEGAWRRVRSRLPGGVVVVSGSLPPGLEPDRFGSFLAGLRAPLAVDASGPALVAALEEGVALIKPNERELSEVATLLGLTAGSDPLAAAGAIHERYGATVLLTRGPKGAALVDEETWLAEAPKVPRGNPVGSGDCLLGAYLLARADGASAEDALRLGVAAGAENVRNGGGGTLRGADVRAVAETVVVRRR